MKSIPIYALYGEQSQDQGQQWLHWETVSARSRLHDFRIEPHRHEQFYQVLFLTHGRAEVSIDGRNHVLAPPAVIAVPALTVHGYVFSTDVEGMVLTLLDRDVRAALATAPDLADALARPLALSGQGADMDAVTVAVRQLIAEADGGGPGHDLAMQARIVTLLVAIHRLRRASTQMAQMRGDRALHHAQSFRALVDTHYRSSRAIAFYAGKLGISAAHLNRVARQVLGASALAVIERRIVLEAKRHLLFSSLGIKEIADLLGYPDPAYFTRFFARAQGMAPGQYRKMVRAGQA